MRCVWAYAMRLGACDAPLQPVTYNGNLSSSINQTIIRVSLHRQRIIFFALLIVLTIAFVLSIALGSVSIPINNVIRVLLGGEADREAWRTIILQLRLPKAITAVLAGAALAIAGLQMQTLFRNPLADPYVLGVSSGASLGVAIAVLGAGFALGVGSTTFASGLNTFTALGVIGAASLGAGLVMALTILVSRFIQNNLTLLVFGLMIGYLTSALVSLMLFFSNPERMQAYLLWTFGSFGGTTWAQLQVLTPVILLVILAAIFSAKSMNTLLLGETYARSLGLNLTRTRIWITATASLLAGAITAFCGPIGFLGIAVPHLARNLLRSADHRLLAWACLLMGAALALLCDLATHFGGVALPLNATTSLIGAPIVVWVILRQRGGQSA